jgi:hypothetical protein
MNDTDSFGSFFLVFSGRGKGGAAHFLPQKTRHTAFIKPR